MAGHIKQLEAEIAELKMRLTKAEATATRRASLTQSQRVTETYKVKTFDLAAKLAKADGSDDGLYNGLPIEVLLCSSVVLGTLVVSQFLRKQLLGPKNRLRC